MPSELEGRVALVTGGGRGIGRNIALELADAGMRVAVAARSRGQVEETAAEAGGLALELDVTDRAAVQAAVVRAEAELGPLDLLCANAGVSQSESRAWEADLGEWWRVVEVNLLGAHLCCSAVIPGMIERGGGRIVITGSGSSYLPGLSTNTAYCASKAAVGRYGEILARELEPYSIPVFVISPGLVRTEMTGGFSDDAPWTPPECAPRLVRALAGGSLDRLSGRYIHAEHDDPDELAPRIDEVLGDDLNAIRLRR